MTPLPDKPLELTIEQLRALQLLEYFFGLSKEFFISFFAFMTTMYSLYFMSYSYFKISPFLIPFPLIIGYFVNLFITRFIPSDYSLSHLDARFKLPQD